MQKPRCKRCNRPLRDPVSIALGIGPLCRSSGGHSRTPPRIRQRISRGHAPAAKHPSTRQHFLPMDLSQSAIIWLHSQRKNCQIATYGGKPVVNINGHIGYVDYISDGEGAVKILCHDPIGKRVAPKTAYAPVEQLRQAALTRPLAA